MPADDLRIHVDDGLAGRRHDHGEAWVVRKGRLRALRVLRALPPATSNDDADQHRTAHDAAEHVAVLGSEIDDLVHRQESEIGADMRGDGVITDQRRADGDARHALFHKRHVEDALGSVFFGKAGRRTEDALKVVDTLPHDEGVRIGGEARIHGFQEGAGVGQHPGSGGLRLLCGSVRSNIHCRRLAVR